MAKITCESCETSFKYELVKNMKKCPVCGMPLWDEEDCNNDVDNGAVVLEKKKIM